MFRDLRSELEAMEAAGKVDLKIVSKLDEIVRTLSLAEDRWVSNTKADTRDAFAMYHSLRVIHMVAEELKRRISGAERPVDNPLIVEQTLKLLPMLARVQESATAFLTQEMPKGTRKAMHTLVQTLKETAEDFGLYPSLEREAKDVSKDKLQKQLREVIARVSAQLEI